MKEVWEGSSGIYAPRDLKEVIGQFAPQFAGWGQQDSHELITFMLDGIHEDLNRCKQKPVVEAVIGDGTNDEKIAKEAWDRHLKRNNSVIVDNFQGQLRSRLNCPNCGKTTVVFDPYLALSLPIEKQSVINFSIDFVPYDFKNPIITLHIPLSLTSKPEDVDKAISKAINRNVSVRLGSRTKFNMDIK